MFTELFAEAGLSLDRLRALVEVGASGSIVKAADADPVKQSQYSRQIKELEDFFRTKLVERHGRGVRLTSSGKELARISRFLLLGLSNFRRGCLKQDQTFCIGSCATVIRQFLIPTLATHKDNVRFSLEVVAEDEIERRLHDLTLDFGIVTRAALSRPLQSTGLGETNLNLWVPKALFESQDDAYRAFKERKLPMALAETELEAVQCPTLRGHQTHLSCTSFLEARAALEGHALATVLPEFLKLEGNQELFLRLSVTDVKIQFRLAWNPRLLRLNPLAVRRRDVLWTSLVHAFNACK
jgi:DNA-binding transcriptional LysR family regulator